MANNNKNNQPKAENKNKNKGNVAAQTQQGSKPKVEAPEVPIVQTEEVVDTTTLRANGTKIVEVVAKTSPESKMQFATLAQERYIRDPQASMKYSQKFIDEMDNVIDGVMLMYVIDLREEFQQKGGDLNVMCKTGLTALQITEVCKLMGVTLGAPKMLPDGQGKLEFKDAVIDENIQQIVDNEKKARKTIEEKLPELDPSKMTTDDELKAAIEYQMRSTPNVLKSLVNTIEWLRNYRNFKAQSADEKLKLEDRTIGVWVDEILSIIKPTLLLTGIGRAIYVSAAQDGTPITAHCSVRKNVKDEDGKAILTEEQCAELVITLLKANAKFSLAKEPEAMKGKTIMDDRAIKTLVNGNEALIDKIMSKEEDLDKKIYSIILKQYYPNPEGDMTQKVHNKIGQLMNLYLPVEERMDSYPTIEDEQEYPEAEASAADEKKN